MKENHKTRKRNGFTLIEMTVVLFIISLLMLLILPNISKQKDRADETHSKAMVSVVQNQVENYENDKENTGDKNKVPGNLDQLHGYLNDDQISKARREGISIDHNGKVLLQNDKRSNG